MLMILLANMLILAHAVVPHHHHQQLQGLPPPAGRTDYQALEGKDYSPIDIIRCSETKSGNHSLRMSAQVSRSNYYSKLWKTSIM